MPELPEVETMVRGVAPAVLGRMLHELVPAPCPCRPLTFSPRLATIRRRLARRTIADLARVGKRIVFRFDSNDRLVIEPRMTGLLLVSDPPDPDHLRLEFRLAGRRAPHSVYFWDRRGLGTITLLSDRAWNEWLEQGRLGPDALALDVEDWVRIFQRINRPVKVALLDQRLVAGIGNLYASEILHRARVHPERRTLSLRVADFRRLHEATLHILNEAIRYEGSTLSDGTYRNALNQNGGYQNEHRVYDREGEACRTCGAIAIRRIVQAQRSTFFCRACQPAARGR